MFLSIHYSVGSTACPIRKVQASSTMPFGCFGTFAKDLTLMPFIVTSRHWKTFWAMKCAIRRVGSTPFLLFHSCRFLGQASFEKKWFCSQWRLSRMTTRLMSFVLRALGVIGNIVFGSEEQTQAVLDAGFLKIIPRLLVHKNVRTRYPFCVLLSSSLDPQSLSPSTASTPVS
jgi:hypothetical protein